MQKQAEKALEQRDLDRAGELCRQILEAQPDHGHALYLLGAVAQMSGRYRQARELFEKAISQDDKRPEYHALLACALLPFGLRREAGAVAGAWD